MSNKSLSLCKRELDQKGVPASEGVPDVDIKAKWVRIPLVKKIALPPRVKPVCVCVCFAYNSSYERVVGPLASVSLGAP